MGCKKSKSVKPNTSLVNNVSVEVSEKPPIQVRQESAGDKDDEVSKLTGKKRILRELKYFNESAPSNMRLAPSFNESNLNEWIVDVDGAKGTIYEGDKFKLKFVFPQEYPRKAPTIIFVPGHVPIHPHIYSNGHMCLEILYEGYQPQMTLVYICNGIMLLLDRNNKKELPYNDAWYLRMGIKDPNHGMWGWEEML